MKKQRGITLVALVITIIILTILAGISISVLLGEDGLIGKTQSGKENYISESEKEQNLLNNINSYITGGDIPSSTEEEYIITLDLDGGTGNGSMTYTSKTETFTLPYPEKTGFYFVGWTGDNGTVPQYTVTIPKNSSGNKSYKANWDDSFFEIVGEIETVSTGGNDASIRVKIFEDNIEETIVYSSVKNSSKNYKYLSTWYNSGWKVQFNSEYDILYSTDNTASSYTVGSSLSWGYNVSKHYYIAKGKQFNIECDLVGGIGKNNISYSKFSDTFSLPRPIKSGYNFSGWTGSNGTIPEKNVEIINGTIGNKRYVANWTPTNTRIVAEIETISTGDNDASIKVKDYINGTEETILYSTVRDSSKYYQDFEISYGKTFLNWRINKRNNDNVYYCVESEYDHTDNEQLTTVNWGFGTSIHYFIITLTE